MYSVKYIAQSPLIAVHLQQLSLTSSSGRLLFLYPGLRLSGNKVITGCVQALMKTAPVHRGALCYIEQLYFVYIALK